MLKSDCSYIHLPLGKVTGSEHTKLFNSTVCSLQNQWNNPVCLEDSCTSKRTNCASNSCNYNSAACNASLPHLSSSDRNPTLVSNTSLPRHYNCRQYESSECFRVFSMQFFRSFLLYTAPGATSKV